MPIRRLRKAKYTLDLRMKKDERRKLKTGKDMDLDLKVVERLWDGLEPKEKIVKICKESGLSPTYTKILIKRIKREKMYE